MEVTPNTPRKYQRTQREYADQYGKGIATIKRAAAKGLPLDDPDAMAEFWVSRAGRKPEQSRSGIPQVDPELPIQLEEDFFHGDGILASIERLKKAERERSAAYFLAIIHGKPEQIRNRFFEWTGIIEALRKLAKDEPTIRKLNGLLIEVADVEATWSETLASFRAAAQNLPGSAADRLVGLTEYHEIRAVLEEEIDVLLKALDTKPGTNDDESPATCPEDHPASDDPHSTHHSVGMDR